LNWKPQQGPHFCNSAYSYISVSQPFSLRGTLLTYKKFCGTPLLYKKIPRNSFVTQKNYGQPLIYWYKAFLYKLGNCIVKMTQIPSEHIKKEWIKTEILFFFKFGGTPRRPLRNPRVPRNPGWETLSYINLF